MTITETEAAPQRGPLELRAVAETLDVSFPERRIRLVVMPYDQETVVAFRGRPIVEVCAPGAFEGVEKRHRAPRAFRDHDRRLVFGHASHLDTTDAHGLIAEIEVQRTQLGDETLELARAGDLDASAGFNVLRDGERWSENRQHRRLTKLWLDHIALTADPAYPGASVLDVRENDLDPPISLSINSNVTTSSWPNRMSISEIRAIEASELEVPVSLTPRKDGILAKVTELRARRSLMFPPLSYEDYTPGQ